MARGFSIGIVAFSCKVNYTNNLTIRTSKTGLIAEIKKSSRTKPIVDLNILILNLSNVFQVSFLQSLAANIS